MSEINEKVVEKLLNHGASPTATNQYGLTAIQLAQGCQNLRISYLLERSAQPYAEQGLSLISHREDELMLRRDIEEVCRDIDSISREVMAIKRLLRETAGQPSSLATLLQQLRQPWELLSSKALLTLGLKKFVQKSNSSSIRSIPS